MDRYAEFASEAVTAIYPGQIKDVRNKAEMNHSRKRFRICAHMSTEDELQEMYICAKDEGYIPVYRHPDTATTHMILEGTIAIVVFDDMGNIDKVVVLDKERGALSCRVGKNIYYMTFLITEWATYAECKAGPFTDQSNIVAPWAPCPEDTVEVNQLMQAITDAVENECNSLGIDYQPDK